MDKKKILVIEDNVELLTNIKMFLEEEGFEIITDEKGSKAVEITKKWKPDLIVCDIALPFTDGYKILEELSKENDTKTIPFIFLTAKTESNDMRKGMILGADDYIVKPFDLDDLLMSINKRIEKFSILASSANHVNGKENHFKPDEKILINFGSQSKFYRVDHIKFLRSEKPYLFVKFIDGKNTLIRETLDEWETKLPEKFFLRIHRSTIVNSEYILKIEKSDTTSSLVFLKNEPEPFTISRRYNSKIKAHLGRLSIVK